MVAVPSRGRADLQAHAPEADAASELYRRYERQLYAYCFSRLRSREEAEDAVQSTFLNAFRALQRDVAPAHEAAWLYKIAENVCLTRARSSVRRRRVETPGDLETISEVVPAHVPDAEELVNLPQALESMPEQQRRALLLREWQGLSYREIAEEMQLSQAAVETLLFRARRTLASGLSDEPVRKKTKLARLRAGGDAGAIIALIKTLLFSGGAKVVVVGAVAASGVVGVSPSARHTIDELIAPHVTAAAPVHHAVAAKPKATVVTKAPVYVAPVAHHAAPVVSAVKKAHHRHAGHPVVVVRHAPPRHTGRHGRIDVPAPAVAPAVAAPAAAVVQQVTPLEATPAPATTPQQAQPVTPVQGDDTPAPDPVPTPPAPVVPPVVQPPVPVPVPGDDGHGNGDRGHDGHGGGHEKQ